MVFWQLNQASIREKNWGVESLIIIAYIRAIRTIQYDFGFQYTFEILFYIEIKMKLKARIEKIDCCCEHFWDNWAKSWRIIGKH
jgi:hypothetical protein